MVNDFSASMYQLFLTEIIDSGYSSSTVSNWCENNQLSKTIVLRHDVDRCPRCALSLAHIEYDLGISSTYYFRARNHVFKPSIVKEIDSLGHEIGYHYEVISEAKGDISKAKTIFMENLNKFREIVTVKTVSMHGRPLSPYNEINFWKHARLSSFDLIGEAYLSFEKRPIPYLNDTGRTWADGVYNLRDKMSYQQDFSIEHIHSTQDLIKVVKQGRYSELYLSFHPERWPVRKTAQYISFAQDTIFNQIKRMLRVLRHDRA